MEAVGHDSCEGCGCKKSVLSVVGKIGDGNGARCFEPRHGIRATDGKKSVDLVICFECGWVYVFVDNDEKSVQLNIKGNLQPALDKVLTDAKVPLPKLAKE
jgi:hypothetical protein